MVYTMVNRYLDLIFVMDNDENTHEDTYAQCDRTMHSKCTQKLASQTGNRLYLLASFRVSGLSAQYPHTHTLVPTCMYARGLAGNIKPAYTPDIGSLSSACLWL